MREHLVLISSLFLLNTHAQQVDWLKGDPVDFALNPGMPWHAVASAPEHLVAMRTVDVTDIYGNIVFGAVALEALDPATGDTWLTCLLGDSVSVGAAVVSPVGIAYFSGSFIGDALEFCDGSQLLSLGAGFTVNHFVMAWNLNTGQPLWSRVLDIDFPGIIEHAALAVDPNGNLWFAATEFTESHIVEVDFFGENVQSRTVGGLRRLHSIGLDPWGGLYASGSCENGTLTFGGQQFPVSSTEGYNMFVLRYRPDGTAGFAQFGPDVTFTDPTVVATSDGHAYLAGALHLDGEVWQGLQFEGPSWGADVFIAKLDSTGQFLWGREAHQAGNDITGDVERAQGPCIAVDAEDHVYFTGAIRGVVDWGAGVLSEGVIPHRSLTVVSFDTDGTPRWATSSEPSQWFVTAQGLTATASPNTVHFAAHAADELTMGVHTVGASGQQTAVVGRLSNLSTGVPQADASSELFVWPNPVADVLFVEVDATSVIPAELMNSAGQRMRMVTLLPGRNVVNVGGLAPGLYLLRVANGRAVRVVKE